jgi:pimeloyl-ACP methyl ester carboxylesterase
MLAEIIKAFFYLIFVAVAVSAVVFIFQRRMLYQPDRGSVLKKDLRGQGLMIWPAETEYRGLVSRDPSKGDQGTVVVFHGNAGAAFHRAYYIRFFEKLGYRAVLAEYPGYGGRPGKMSEKIFINDGLESVKRISELYKGPVYLCGESLGCGVALGVAARSAVPVRGVLLITPWDTLPDLAQSILWFLPVRWFVLDKYDNIQNMKKAACRAAVILAQNDEIIPEKRSRRLFQSIETQKKLWVIPGADHNSWPQLAGPSLWSEVMDFVSGM